ncbi:MAG TPA: thiamine pyrophosphate-binding protein [Alphaproteobacteria bacterium]|jgi:acetolactate synthase-1/2/3 large subunit|nr:thiamine pyrophosphate-binding protein [Alphaproteobacteria bacterium]MDP6270372.1 thiamine pyrophosphate-binding protein [Alphaproteobacteria bacterium]MDP7164793.1 thiamine pyrophosphate-binding protein [Alphaproteobacteria bacterium]MDP7429290.1 thiamine pyrophosphate-binding protein [Alphaproteobacteria bacterium]HJM49230.1 thiamine pyrophosphate-binding protein [Alphaproteobacteria bacterium]
MARKDNLPNGAEAFVRLLELHGVEHVFGLCGDTSLPLYDALYRLDHGITHILCRDERSAAYMADVYARLTGRVGVCEGPSGGGVTYMLPGITEAHESSVALLAVTSDIAVSSRDRQALTALDQESLMRPVTKWNRVIESSHRVPLIVRNAFARLGTGSPGAVHLGLPVDVQSGPVDQAEIWGEAELGRFPARRTGPGPKAVAAAAAALSSAERPLLLAGGGPLFAAAEAELRELAERLGAPVATTVSGHGVLPDDHPLALGVTGSNGGVPEVREVVLAADLVVFVGCRAGSVTTEKWRLPEPRQRIVHIDADPAVIGINYRTEAALVGDAKLALAALLDELPSAPRKGWGAAAVAAAKAQKFARFERLASDEVPIRPERLIAELQAVLPGDAVIVADPGTPTPFLSAYYRLDRAGRHLVFNRAHGALGYALPGVVGAYFARPDKVCVGIMGDGGFGFASGELETIARLALPVVLVVVNNATFGWIKAGQHHGYEGRYQSVDFSPGDHAAVAAAYGFETWRVEDPDKLGAALGSAVACQRPALVDVVCQPLHETEAPVSEWIA